VEARVRGDLRTAVVEDGPAWGFLALVSGCALIYVAFPVDVVRNIAFAVAGLLSIAAMIYGPRRNEAQTPPWNWAVAGAILAVVGALVRQSVANVDGLESMGDFFSIPSYFCYMVGFWLLLKQKGSLDRHALADSGIVFVAALLVSTVAFAIPAFGIADRSPLVAFASALYPVLDVILVLILVNLSITTSAKLPSYLLLVAGMVGLLIGDLGYAFIGAQGELSGSRIMDLPFFMCLGFVAAAALHSSVRELGTLRSRPTHAWSIWRLSLLIPALITPAVVMLVNDYDRTVRLLATGAMLAMVGLIAFRAVAAVRENAKVQESLQVQATTDPLTGLPNRAALARHMADRLVGPKDVWWVLFCDLDDFKLVNDSRGHEAGDRLIEVIGTRLRTAFDEHHYVARVGGDEFVVIGPGELPEAESAATRLLSILQRPVRLDRADIVVGGSVGIALRRAHATAQSLLRDADTAMYNAKASGGNRAVLFDATMREHVRNRVEIELALRHAVEREELFLHFQPIVSIPEGRWRGLEALIRWNHPVRGNMPPLDFIPIAEETGLIVPVGTWVLRQSIAHLAALRSQGLVDDDFTMSVNVSPRQMQDDGFTEIVAEALAQYGIPGENLVLEVTESIMVDPDGDVIDVFHDLRALGIGIAVDDFGTGYSALSYLRALPVTSVKIDRSFVAGIGGNEQDEQLVRVISDMAATMHLAVVAEGVETIEQSRALSAFGVTRAQGWLYGRPMAAQSVIDHFRGDSVTTLRSVASKATAAS